METFMNAVEHVHLFLSADVPHEERNIFILQILHIEAHSRHGINNLAKF